jgi:hypothetical protein
MQIPLYNAQIAPQPDPGAARGDVAAAGRGAQALTNAADQFGAELAAYSKAAENARRAQQLTAATGTATRALQEAVLQAEQDTDYSTLPDRFGKKLGEIRDTTLKSIEDPVVQGLFSRDWQRLTLPQELAVRRDARKREVDAMGATLDDTLTTLVPMAVQAGTPDQRQAVVDQARIEIARNAELGIISRADAGKRERGFLSQIDEAQVLGRLNVARNAGDPDQADAVMADLTTGKYANLDPTAVERMVRTAQSERDSLRRDLVSRQEKAERDADKAQRERQAQKEADFILNMDKDPSNPDAVREIDLQDALKRQQISPEGYRMLVTRRQGNLQGVDVPAVEGDLRSRMVRDGVDIHEDVLRARNNGQLSQRTADDLIRQNQEAIASRAKEPWKSADQKRGHEFVTRFLGGDQPMVNLSDTQTQRLALAQRDYARLVLREGVDPDQAARQITARYVDEIKVSLRSDYFGDADLRTQAGINSAARRIQQLKNSGLIDPATAAAEADKLKEAARLLQQPAPGAPPANTKGKP